MGRIYAQTQPQRVSGWCKDMRVGVNGRPGADFLNNRSREVRVSPLQRLSARQTGIQVVPRKIFRPEKISQGVFIFRPEETTQTKGVRENGKRITEGL